MLGWPGHQTARLHRRTNNAISAAGVDHTTEPAGELKVSSTTCYKDNSASSGPSSCAGRREVGSVQTNTNDIEDSSEPKYPPAIPRVSLHSIMSAVVLAVKAILKPLREVAALLFNRRSLRLPKRRTHRTAAVARHSHAAMIHVLTV